MEAFAARYNDGRTAASVAAQVRPDPDGLIVTDPDGGEIDRWAWPDVQLAEPPARERPARFSNRARPGARLAVDDPAVLPVLCAHTKYLHREPLGRKRILTVAGIAAGCAATIGFFIYGLPWVARPLAAIVPVGWEEPVGESTVTIVNQLFARGRKLCSNAAGDDAIQSLARRLSDSAATPYDIRVSVADSGIVNALAAPGGRIVIFRGLIDRAVSADEVAGVLAHEMAHVVHRHPTQGMIAAIGWSALMSVFTGGASLSNEAAAQLAAHLATSAHSRDLEAEADQGAIAMLAASSIGSAGLADFFRSMEAEEKEGLQLPAYLSTHPQTNKRIEAAEKSTIAARKPALS
ncbi:MAG: M48 family metallopeptidase, partial [Alphaproteobacteria bacterium]